MAKIWLAGTLGNKAWKKQVTKREILQEDIQKSCNSVQRPPVALAFSTEGILLYGVCRIYHYQVTSQAKKTNEIYGKLIRFARQVERADINLGIPELQADINEITLQHRISLEIDDIGDIHIREVF